MWLQTLAHVDKSCKRIRHLADSQDYTKTTSRASRRYRITSSLAVLHAAGVDGTFKRLKQNGVRLQSSTHGAREQI